MLNRIKDIVRFYIPFDDDDISVLESISLLQDVATAAIIKLDDYELFELLESSKDEVSSADRTKWFAKVLRRYNIDIYKEAKDPVTAQKYLAFYGNPVKGRRGDD